MKALVPILTLLALAGCQSSEPSANSPSPSVTASGETQKRVVTVDGAFSPETLEVKAGQPVEITFDTKRRSCATEVIFEGLGIKEPLTDGQKSVVTFTPKAAGTYTYACPMNMMTGKIVAK